MLKQHFLASKKLNLCFMPLNSMNVCVSLFSGERGSQGIGNRVVPKGRWARVIYMPDFDRLMLFAVNFSIFESFDFIFGVFESCSIVLCLLKDEVV